MIITILIFIIGLLLGVIGYNYVNKVNANNIKWDGLTIENDGDETQKTEIKSTEDLINLINNIQKEVYVLSAAVIALSGTIKK